MKRVIKLEQSEIVVRAYTYPDDRVAILEQLEIEHEFFCAYTEEYFCPGYARDIEHFDPTLKNTAADGYNNWFPASARINRRKGSKARWSIHQPILHPTNENLEDRLIYKNGDYITLDPADVEAKNLIDFLFLNDMGLPRARVYYINSLKEILRGFGGDIDKLKEFLIRNKNLVQYRTAIKVEFGLDL